MAEPALISELRQRADRDVDAIWQKARADAEACREQAARDLEDARVATARHVTERTRAAAAAAMMTAETEARRIRTAATAAVAERVHALAAVALARARDADYPAAFAALVRELPSRQWETIVVNPADEQLARQQIAGARIVCDLAIGLGAIATAEGGRVRVDNTLAARLESAWPDLLPQVMRDVLHSVARL